MRKTKNYAKFILYEDFHRKTTIEYLKQLEKEILEENRLKDYPIEITERNEIIDGRHRFLIAKKNNLYIYYNVTTKSKDYYKWMEENYHLYHTDTNQLFLLDLLEEQHPKQNKVERNNNINNTGRE